MAHYVMSDLHGEIEFFHKILSLIAFSQNDVLYIIGDVLDRGPNPVGLLKEIMAMKNCQMILGNHEYMCLDYFSPNPSEKAILRWNKNGNEPTLKGLKKLSKKEFNQVITYLKSLPDFLEVTIGEKAFHLVHGFPASNTHDRVWNRPYDCTSLPFKDKSVILGHTPVLDMMEKDEEKQKNIIKTMAERKEHLKILHSPFFIDLDCCCGYDNPVKSLSCLRLEDMKEFYVI
ncbi:MAG: fructose-bisphosphatase class III [Sphaerochaetaceae bacterium]|nr:fructose-bisphosphatase class III [Sphaerochaetaceae bacterium]